MRAIINCISGASMRRALLTAFLIGAAVPALADDSKISIAIRDTGFVPAEVAVPSGIKIELSIKNEQNRAAEFESSALRREKVIPPGATGTVYVGPLQPGRYEFFDDFQPNNRGFLVAQ
jgi:Cupredoxin-like domain